MAENRLSQKPLWRITNSERRFILFLGDILSAGLGLVFALYFWAMKDQWMDFTWQFLKERPPDWFYFIPLIWIVLMIELYDVRRASRRADTIKGIAGTAAISTVLYLLIFFVAERNALPRRGVAGFIIAASILTLLWRLLYIKIFTAPAFLKRVLIIGAGRSGSTLAEMIQKMTPVPFSLVGFIDDDPKKAKKKIAGLPVLGKSQDLLKIIDDELVSDLIFSISGDMQPSLNSAILSAEEQGVEVNTMPVVYEELFGRVPITLLDDDWVLRSFVDRAHASSSYELFKRLLDVFFSIVGLAILIPLFPFIALLIIIDDGTPIIFRQVRVGKNGQHFKLLKFRSMRRDAEEDGIARFAVENDDRATRIGKFLRRSHLDELPQFINVLRGEISMVGPRAERPELIEKLQQEVPFYRARLFVKPGATGWAQINYQYASNVEETAVKLEHDLYYIMHRSVFLDLMIMVRTIGAFVGFHGL
jgi:exopolysaccharide biosynthesis polyprenyl glycosylphosphotransferase